MAAVPRLVTAEIEAGGKALTAADPPQDPGVRPRRHEPATVRAERGRLHIPEGTDQLVERCSGAGEPDSGGVVPARGRDQLAVRAELDVGDRPVMPKDVGDLARRSV